MTTKITAKTPAKLPITHRLLSNVFLVSSDQFGKQSAARQTAILAEGGGTRVMFLPNFSDLSNRTIIRDKLLAGKDVSIELEFNNIELTEEDRKALTLVTPVLKKISAIGPRYSWLPAKEFPDTEIVGSVVRRGNNRIALSAAKALWRKCSKYWSGGRKPDVTYTAVNGANYNNHNTYYSSDGINIGCQTISRAEVEYVARLGGWEPVVFEG